MSYYVQSLPPGFSPSLKYVIVSACFYRLSGGFNTNTVDKEFWAKHADIEGGGSRGGYNIFQLMNEMN